MTIAGRPELTRQSLRDLADSNLESCNLIVLVFDGYKSISDFGEQIDSLAKKCDIHIIYHDKSIGIKKSLIEGIEHCFYNGCDVVTNLDNDVRLKPNWLEKLLDLYNYFPNHIITGFHSTTKNKDGSERHKIVAGLSVKGPLLHDWVFKESVGGINMLFNFDVYEKYILPALVTPEGNWDYIACRNSYLDSYPICVAVPSLIQHTGIHESSMGHNSELPDVADDWNNLELNDVTLFGLDDRSGDGLEKAMEICQRNIKFGDVLRLHNPVDGKKGYSEFMIHHLHNYVHTSHVLVVQADGYIINPEAWDPNWLEYDYIGATWLYKDGMNVGNGGFSLRSHKLCDIISQLVLNDYHPEDYIICRKHRKLLEDHGIKFAPEEVANRFSIEAYGSNIIPGANNYSGQFGFHGYNVDFSDWNGHKPTKKQTKRSNIFDNFI